MGLNNRRTSRETRLSQPEQRNRQTRPTTKIRSSVTFFPYIEVCETFFPFFLPPSVRQNSAKRAIVNLRPSSFFLGGNAHFPSLRFVVVVRSFVHSFGSLLFLAPRWSSRLSFSSSSCHPPLRSLGQGKGSVGRETHIRTRSQRGKEGNSVHYGFVCPPTKIRQQL